MSLGYLRKSLQSERGKAQPSCVSTERNCITATMSRRNYKSSDLNSIGSVVHKHRLLSDVYVYAQCEVMM
jgi:hypothetical protein